MSRAVVGSVRQPKLEERFAREWKWALRYLPDQHPGMVVTAMEMLRLAGQPVTVGMVKQRLKHTGRWQA